MWGRDFAVRVGGRRDRPPPPVEPAPARRLVGRGRSWEACSALRAVLPRIEQHVPERVPNLARRLEWLRVEAAIDHRTGSREHAVRGAGETRSDALHARSERRGGVRFDDQMDVIAHDRVVDDAEVGALARPREGAAELRDEAAVSQRRNVAADSDRDVEGRRA